MINVITRVLPEEYELYEDDHLIEDEDCVYFTRIFGYPIRRWHYEDGTPCIETVPFIGY